MLRKLKVTKPSRLKTAQNSAEKSPSGIGWSFFGLIDVLTFGQSIRIHAPYGKGDHGSIILCATAHCKSGSPLKAGLLHVFLVACITVVFSVPLYFFWFPGASSEIFSVVPQYFRFVWHMCENLVNCIKSIFCSVRVRLCLSKFVEVCRNLGQEDRAPARRRLPRPRGRRPERGRRGDPRAQRRPRNGRRARDQRGRTSGGRQHY